MKAVTKHKAIFLDRDGTLNNNKDHYYIWRREDFRLNEGVIEALREFRRRGYLLFVITNQGGISKGLYQESDVEALHNYLLDLLSARGIRVEAIHYCPHHDSVEKCLCRKPLPLMIQKAMARFQIDAEKSWMIGDSPRDSKAGKAAGLRTIEITSNSDLRQVLDQIEE